MTMTERDLLARIADEYRRVLGDNLVGVYLHGSIAMGCFTWETGDIDFLVVVEAPLTQAEKEALVRVLLDMDREATPKGFEMSVMLRSACRIFVHPAAFELHFSNAHKARAAADLAAYCRDMPGTDPDLAAHVTVLRTRGERLCGAEIDAVFGEVPRAAYVDSLMCDIASAEEDIADNPVYVTLNLCRVLAYLMEGSVLSKAEGGTWGLTHLPEKYHPLLQAALNAYGGAVFPAGIPLTAFAAEMLQCIRELV
jgi:streptomycin 3"-adenylyltransferase